MKNIVISMALLIFVAPAVGATKGKCRKGLVKVSCEDIKSAKRGFFCVKKKPSEKAREKICKMTKKKRGNNPAVVKKDQQKMKQQKKSKEIKKQKKEDVKVELEESLLDEELD